MELFDTHCHLDVPEFAADRTEVLARARAAGVRWQVIPAVRAATWGELLALCRTEAGLYPALGLHPVYLAEHSATDVVALDSWVARECPLAIGEIGLDFFVPDLDRQAQQVLFDAQLAVAEKHQLPVLLHVRKAHDQVLQSLKKFQLVGGIAHAFNGSLQQAEQYMALGFCFGFGGMLSYPRSTRLRALAQTLPLEHLVLETDAPDMTPVAHHGQRNSPEYLPEILTSLAELRGMDEAELALQTAANARRVLRIAAWRQ
jgi:TatD DNase family protein